MASSATQFDTDCKLMLHCNGSDASTTFTDSSTGGKTVTAVGNAQIDTAQSKFGGASGLFDGTGDYLTVADSADWDFGTGDFTVDFWARFSAVATNMAFFIIGDTGSGKNVGINVGNTSQIQTHANGAERTAAFSWSNDTWYHVAWTRSGTSNKLFVGGTALDTWTNAFDMSGSTGGVTVGYDDRGDIAMNGWIDEFRIVKGTAVWTSDFTPPSAEYTPVADVNGNFLMFC